MLKNISGNAKHETDTSCVYSLSQDKWQLFSVEAVNKL